MYSKFISLFQVKLYKDFLYEEDAVIRYLEQSMEELKKHKLDLPGPPTKDELPIGHFGVFKEPTFEQIVGIRKDKFTEKEKETNEIVTLVSDNAKEAAERDRECQLSVGDSVGFTGTDYENTSTLGSCTTLASKSSTCDSIDDSSIDECTRL